MIARIHTVSDIEGSTVAVVCGIPRRRVLEALQRHGSDQGLGKASYRVQTRFEVHAMIYFHWNDGVGGTFIAFESISSCTESNFEYPPDKIFG